MVKKSTTRTSGSIARKTGSQQASDERNFITIRGAREHNLQDVSLRLPKNKLIVMSGVSGSGKSSLAFDTLYAEGQRRYVESLSSYARQFLGQMPKPEVDSITGLAPSISIQQKTSGRNPRSTVGTITEVYDYLRVLFARVGKQHCPQCSRAITAQSAEHIIDTISLLAEGEKFSILAPLIEGQKGEYRDLFDDLLKQGFVRARVDGRVVALNDDIRLDKQMRHTIEVVIDRLVAGKTPRARLAEAVELALRQADGKLIVSRESDAEPGTGSFSPRPGTPRRGAGGEGQSADDVDITQRPLTPNPSPRSTGARGTEFEAELRNDEGEAGSQKNDRLFSSSYACTHCGLSFDPPSPQLFSFNSPQGMCKDCNGLGERFEFVLEQLVEDPTISLWKGALALVGSVEKAGRWRKHIYLGAAAAIEEDLGLGAGTVLKTTWDELSDDARHKFLFGLGDRHVTFEMRYSGGVWKHGGTFKGVVNELLEEYRKAKNPMRRKQIEKFMRFNRCSTCNGSRLNRQAASVLVTSLSAEGTRSQALLGNADSEALLPVQSAAAASVGKAAKGKKTKSASQKAGLKSGREAELPDGRSQAELGNECASSSIALSLSLPQVCGLDVESAYRFFEKLDLSETAQLIAEEVLKEIRGRLGFLLRCGLNYLTLDRTAPTLSGGESQRIRLAGQIGCGLCDVVYILDEPSIGLHPRDNTMLLGSLQDLRDQGNTVIVVEHDDETMLAADHIVDFGPGPGVRGGEVVAEGSVEDIKQAKRSVTGAFLSKRREIAVPEVRRAPKGIGPISQISPIGPLKSGRKGKAAAPEQPQTADGSGWNPNLRIRNARHHNLKGVDVDIPLGLFVCVTGVSGSGKSSLVNDILWEVLNRDLNKGDGKPGEHESISGLEQLDKAIDIDQSPIGRTPRSNPATYVKLADLIRDLYTQLPEAKRRGFKPGRFSFNVSGGRCEACEGHGANKLEMDFLADIWVTCPVCGGKRFNHETLEVRFKGKNIAEVLEMDVQEGLEHFENVPKIKNMLQTLHDVGLDYLKLGQPSPTLSGGEAQRIKLARELGKRSTGKTIYLLDEPTTGLHFADIEKLLEVLHGFVDAGNTVLVVEHNLDVIKTADWIIDIGPEGGSGGGTVVCCGTPEEVARCERSHTGRALRAVLGLSDAMSGSPRPGTPGRGAGGEGPTGSSTVPSTFNRHALPLTPDPSPRSTGARGESALRLGVDRAISIRGAAQHNLQRIDLTIPREQMNVFCGPSGSGKSSLAMDTLYAEGQRRYVESLSAYARQFLGQMPKPKVEHIHGLQPAIAIEQKTVGSTPRSTIGTVTEIYDYLRILWCRLGTLHCPDCKQPVDTQTTDQVVGKLLTMPEGTKLLLLAPQEVKVGQHYEKLWQTLTEQGYARVRVDGMTYRLDEVPDIDRKSKHNVEVVVDRITIKREQRTRLAESIEAALDLGKGLMRVAHVDESRDEPDWKVDPFSLHRACEKCGRSFEELTPNNFSFNSPLGWCSSCEGLGTQRGTDLRVLIGDPNRSLRDAAVSAWPDPRSTPFFAAMLEAMARELGWDLSLPFSQLDPTQRRQVLYGTGEKWFDASFNRDSGTDGLGPEGAAHTSLGQATEGSAALGNSPKTSRALKGHNKASQRSGAPSGHDVVTTITQGGAPVGRLPWADMSSPVGAKTTREDAALENAADSARDRAPQRVAVKRSNFRFQYKGLFPAIEEAARVSYQYRQRLFELVGEIPCSTCDGSRLRDDAGAVRFQGKTLQQICEMPLGQAYEFLNAVALSGSDAKVAGDLLIEAQSRMKFLIDVGLEYLTLSRSLPTLSGGESQRIRLAGQIGRALTGVLYVLDEPTIGLHPRDNARLLQALKKLKELGNTLVLVEHDKEVIAAADRIYDFGPGAGRFGGTVVDEGSPKDVSKRAKGLTGQYLGKKREIVVPLTRRVVMTDTDATRQRPGATGLGPEGAADISLGQATEGSAALGKDAPTSRALKGHNKASQGSGAPSGHDVVTTITRGGAPDGRLPRADISSPVGAKTLPTDAAQRAFVGPALELLGARLNNLRDVNLRIPLGSFCCITGVSGSGKSSLIEHTLAKALLKHLHRSTEQPGPYDKLVGLNLVDKAIVVDQQPIGFTPKSNPGTYTGVFDHIRELFARLPESKVRGYAAGRFSFNRAGGRCEACEGDGQKKIEMHFLPDVWVQCEECRGQRYNTETLSVRYKGKSISDVLDMSIGQCLELFENIPAIRKMLATLCAIGLDYLTLGQSATTLSGGEAQRVKLATELARPSTGKTIYILDEPTTGLHFDDIDKLLKVLNSLVELGNTVVVVEHNLDVIKTADWIIDLGPEAGQGGGWIVAEGTPEDIVRRGVAPQLSAELRSNSATTTRHRSHTAEQLAPVLAASTRAERAIFNAADVGKKRSGDLSLSEVGKDSKMPWEVDGRKWHTQERLAHNGKRVRWEGEVLARVIETIEELGDAVAKTTPLAPVLRGTNCVGARSGVRGESAPASKKRGKAALSSKLMSGADLLKAQQRDAEPLTPNPSPRSTGARGTGGAHGEAGVPDESNARRLGMESQATLRTIWNDPSTVEVIGDAARYGWFMHALTRDEWLLKLKFRVEKNRFDERELQAKLGLKDVNDVKEIQVYNRSDRVTVKNQRGAFQEVTITVHWLREIDTPEFWEFLQEARESYMQLVTQASTEPEDVTPWKVLGKKWHLLQKGFPAEKRPKWKAEVIEALFETLDSVLPNADVIWTERQMVRYRKQGSKADWAVVVTKRRAGIDITITPDKKVGTGDIAGLATELEVLPEKNGKQPIRLRFLKLEQVTSPRLKAFLKSTLN